MKQIKQQAVPLFYGLLATLTVAFVPTRVWAQAQFVSLTESRVNRNGNLLTVAIPLKNIGTASADNFQVSNIEVANGSMATLTPGNSAGATPPSIAVNGIVRTVVSINSAALVPGSRQLFTVRGTFFDTASNSQMAWSVNRFVTVPSASAASSTGIPTNNPLTAYATAQSWTDDLAWTGGVAWGRVFNIQDYGGGPSVDNFVPLQMAVDAAKASGGGVVYFPAGSYPISDSATLADGVVLRGEEPTSHNQGLNPQFSPPSHLEFPAYSPSNSGSGSPNNTSFKTLRGGASADSNTGLVYLAVSRARVSLPDNGSNGLAWSAGSNRFVFGCTIQNAVTPDPGIPGTLSYKPTTTTLTDTQNAWQRYTYRFSTALQVRSSQNALIANNRLLPATDNFTVTSYKETSADGKSIATHDVLFDYDNRYGIEVNRPSTVGGFGTTPDKDPALFRAGILVADNYAYGTGRVTMTVAGDGAIIRHNEVRNQTTLYNGAGRVARYTVTGLKDANGSSTNENRALDFAGYHLVIDNNTYEAYPGLLADSVYPFTDGEGILFQQSSGTNALGESITNNTGNAYIGLYNLLFIKDCIVQNNTVSSGYITLFSTLANGVVSGNTVSGNTVSVNNLLVYSSNATGIAADNNIAGNQVAGGIRLEGHGPTSDNVVSGPNTITGNTALATGTAIVFKGAPVYTNAALPTTLSANSGFIPAAPPSLTVASTPTSVTLNWQDSSLVGVDETGYNVYSGTTLVSSVGADVTNLTLSNLKPATSYTFSVRGFNTNGEGTAVSTTPAATITPGFNLNNSTSALTIARPNTGTKSGNASVKINWSTSEPVSLTVSGLPAGVTASFSASPVTRPSSTTASTTVTLTLTVSPATAKGTTILTVTGTSSVVIVSNPLTLTIN